MALAPDASGLRRAPQAPWLRVAGSLYAALLGAAGLAVALDAVPSQWVSAVLRLGGAAAGLGVIYALGAPTAPLARRLSFPLLAALMNLGALHSALPLAARGEQLGIPLGVGLAVASAVWCALFGAVTCPWLRWPTALRPLITAALLAGATAFAAFAALRSLSAATAPLTAQLAAYWALWIWGATLAVTHRRHPRAPSAT